MEQGATEGALKIPPVRRQKLPGQPVEGRAGVGALIAAADISQPLTQDHDAGIPPAAKKPAGAAHHHRIGAAQGYGNGCNGSRQGQGMLSLIVFFNISQPHQNQAEHQAHTVLLQKPFFAVDKDEVNPCRRHP